MLDYYRYLWSTTWPYVSVLCGIWGFVLWRMVWKYWRIWSSGWQARRIWVLLGKTALWSGVLAVYTHILLFSQPDWLSQPGYALGAVVDKTHNPETNVYVLDVRTDEEQQQFYVDSHIYAQLNIDDQVSLTYLPVRREVVRCELLERVQDSR